MDEILQQVATGVVTLLGAVLTGLLTWGARSIKQWLEGKAHMATFACATAKLEKLTTEAVGEIEQTLVRQFKVEGRWNGATARDARDAALTIVKRNLGPRGLRELVGCLGLALTDLDDYLVTKIEHTVGQQGSGFRDGPIADW